VHDQDLGILKALVAVAWADGTFAGREKEMLDALLDAYEATEEERRALWDYAGPRRTLDDIVVSDLSADDRRVLFQHAVLLTFADGDQSPAEVDLLRALSNKLRIGDEEARALTASATARAQRHLHLI
jgi:tellurite resistance protein